MDRRKFLKRAIALTAIGRSFGMTNSAAGAKEIVVIKDGKLLNDEATQSLIKSDTMLAEWPTEHGGYPRFDLIKVSQFQESIKKGIEIKKAEITAIAGQKDAPTFANTIDSYSDAGRALGRASCVFGVYTGTMNDKTVQGLESIIDPEMTKLGDEIVQNDALFQRIKTVYNARKSTSLTPEQQRLCELFYDHFTREGAGLPEKDKARLRELNEKLSKLYTDFRHHQLADEEKYVLVLEDSKDCDGLSESFLTGASVEAESKGHKGKWVISNTRSSVEPFLTFSNRRDLREKVWKMFTMRGDNNDANDNKKTIEEILKLRAERAKILGYPTHAHWVVADNMAKTPEAAMALMMKVWKASAARVKEEVQDMQTVADKEKAGIKIEPWDYRYYAEKVRREKYDVNQEEVKEYLQLDKIREGMFWAATQVYHLNFKKLDGIPVVQEDITVYEVLRDGKRVGLWYFDPYSRNGKSSGAWMSEYRAQEKFLGDVTPVVSNNSNFTKGRAGEPVLISWEDAITMFHEFGHALHGLNSNVTYPDLAGTSVKRDFVEFPSQVNERWLPTKEVLSQFAIHYKTGKPIPDELVAKILKSKHFNQGFSTSEYLAAAIYDMKIHLASTPDKTIDPDKFETETMAEIGCPKELVMRHRPTAFGHIFSGDGYAAGYYVYIWADTMSADASEAFEEAGGFYDRKTCDRFHDTIFSVGNSVAPDVAFRNFRGRDVDTNALMRDRGFPTNS